MLGDGNATIPTVTWEVNNVAGMDMMIKWYCLGAILCAVMGCGGGSTSSSFSSQADELTVACPSKEIEEGSLTACMVRDFPEATAVASSDAIDYFTKYSTETTFPWTIFNINALPTEGLSALWAAGFTRSDDVALAISQLQLDRIMSRLITNILPLNAASRQFGSNMQIRLALGFWMAYKETGDIRYLVQADRSAAIVFNAPRVVAISSYSGKSYLLPAYVYSFSEADVFPASGRTLDPNQEATLALMAQLLLLTPNSSFYRDTVLYKLRDDFINAALDMMTLPRCLPTADQDAVRVGCDTTYGWVTIFQLSAINRTLKDPRLALAIQNQYKFYSQITLKGMEERTYPTRLTAPLTLPRDPLFALMVAHELGEISDKNRFYILAGSLLSKKVGQPALVTEPWVAWISRSLDQIVKALPRDSVNTS
jgi:hypothetical protein